MATARAAAARGRSTTSVAIVAAVSAGIAGGLTVDAGVAGLLLGAGVAVVWLALGGPYAFVVGQLGLVVPLGGGPVTTPVAQATLLILLPIDAAVGRAPQVGAATIAAATGGMAVLLAVTELTASPRTAGAVILSATALAAYGVHRYERLSLGLVRPTGPPDPDADATPRRSAGPDPTGSTDGSPAEPDGSTAARNGTESGTRGATDGDRA